MGCLPSLSNTIHSSSPLTISAILILLIGVCKELGLWERLEGKIGTPGFGIVIFLKRITLYNVMLYNITLHITALIPMHDHCVACTSEL